MAASLCLCREIELTRRRQVCQGFSLPEILVSVAILGLITIGLTGFLNAQLSGAVRYEDGARRVDDASRMRHLIDMEVMESEEIKLNVAMPTSCSSEYSASFRLKIDNASSYTVTTNSLASKYIYYQVRPSGIYRCGPPPNDLGSLNLTAADEYDLMTQSLSLSVNQSVSNDRMLEYTLSSATGGSISITSRVFARSAQIN